MSPPEIWYRVEHKVRQMKDRRMPLSSQLDPGKLPQPDFSKIYGHSRFVSAEDIQDHFVARAEAILQNKFDVFGVEVEFDGEIKWHQDPKTKSFWPLKFWSDVNIRDGFEIGGPKFVWELNRLYSLPVKTLLLS